MRTHMLIAAAALLAACAATTSGTREWQAEDPFRDFEAQGKVPMETLPELDAAPVVLRNATVLTAAGQRHSPGHVVLEGGRISAVGAGEPAQIPAGALVYDLAGAFVTPGLIDSHSHLGVYAAPGTHAHSDGNEATAPATGGVWAEHSVWPQDPGFERALAGGVTSLLVLPGSANLVGGRGVTLHMVPTRGSRAMRFPGAPETVKMACGENPKRVYGDRGGPSTRMGNVAGHRAAFLAAQRYQDDWWRYAESLAKARAERPAGEEETALIDLPVPPARDLQMETLAGVLRGEVLAQVHCYQADDMLSFLQVADEFGFSVRSFHHAVEAYKIRDILAAKETASSVWYDWWGFKMEAYDGIPENAALLQVAGARPIIHSDSPEGIQRLNQEAGKAYHAGLRAGLSLTEDQALRWVTANPAWALGIDQEVGTLEVGKKADVVIWNAHPFSVYASALLVFVDGHEQYNVSKAGYRTGNPWSDFELGQEQSP